MNTDDTINRLITVHGEGGLSPTQSDWRAIFSMTGPVDILNLLSFEQHVETEDGLISGAKAYQKYVRGIGTVFLKVGATSIYAGPVHHSFGTAPQANWDMAVLSRYPSADALAQMWLDPTYITAHQSRYSGVKHSLVLAFQPTT